ncbi:MAG TPA: transporter, partial [Bacteroidales bacterium]|nr:transporter [Bacteroidales bacterium]
DLFPEKNITIKKIGLTYSVMNIASSFLGGIPVCHGSGGLAGQYTFGGRTGGAPFIYGLLYVFLGLLFNSNFVNVVQIFPKPILGVILLFEGIALIILVKDIITDKKQFFVAVLVALLANGVPYGYFVGMLFGTIIYYLLNVWFLNNYGKH